jgi:hypothetical protein
MYRLVIHLKNIESPDYRETENMAFIYRLK